MIRVFHMTEKHANSAARLRLALLAATLITVVASLAGFAGKASAEELVQDAVAPSVTYEAHVQNIGWMGQVSDGETAGTTGRALQVEAITANVKGIDGSIRYQTHLANIGWQGWKGAGEMSGTTGQSRRVEAVRIELTGKAASAYDVLYRVHVPEMGWLAWAKNGATAGSEGMGLRIEALQVKLAPKGTEVSGVASLSKPSLRVRAHSANLGWQGAVGEGATAGTTGRGLRLEAVTLELPDFGGGSAITARAHVSNVGWMGWVGSGETVGTTGRSLAMEAIEIRLTGNAAIYYDVYYRAHVAEYGWLGWACNGETAGSTGLAKQMEALEVKLVRKGTAVDRGGSPVAQPKAQAQAPSGYDQRASAFLSDPYWCNGAAWGAGQGPMLSSYSSSGCAAYAADFCKYVFGADKPSDGQAFYSPSEIRAGDVIKVTGNQHWFVVIGRDGNSLYTAEGNWTGGRVTVANGAYTVSGNTLCRNGSRFRTFSVGYHMQ